MSVALTPRVRQWSFSSIHAKTGGEDHFHVAPESGVLVGAHPHREGHGVVPLELTGAAQVTARRQWIRWAFSPQ